MNSFCIKERAGPLKKRHKDVNISKKKQKKKTPHTVCKRMLTEANITLEGKQSVVKVIAFGLSLLKIRPAAGERCRRGKGFLSKNESGECGYRVKYMQRKIPASVCRKPLLPCLA